MAATAFAYRTKSDSSSDSDSDNSDPECKDWKRATRRTNEKDLEQIPIDPPPTLPVAEQQPGPPKRKRNNIWCDVLQDQMMSETLGHCGLKKKPKGYGSRGEESYDYTLKYKNPRLDEDSDTEMSEDEKSEASDTSLPLSFKNKNFKSNSKFVKLDDAGASAAKKIIKTLGEQKKYLIFRIVKHLGIEKAMQMLKRTEEIEENGGMMINSNQRRRTPGGVYFQLLKTDKDIDKATVDKIFEGELTSYDLKRMSEERKKMKKLAAEKKKLLKMLERDMAQPQNPAKEEKQDDNVIEMEDGEVQETSASQIESQNLIINVSKGSDLEDGEMEDTSAGQNKPQNLTINASKGSDLEDGEIDD